MTHTYAILEISQAAYEEISQKLMAAGYEEVFQFDHSFNGTRIVIDMHGIALAAAPIPDHKCHQPCPKCGALCQKKEAHDGSGLAGLCWCPTCHGRWIRGEKTLLRERGENNEAHRV